MKSIFCYFLFLLFFETSYAQNLVPNPSFENLTNCPSLTGQFNFVTDWFITSGTPDLFNVCGLNNLGIPNNARGNQYPLHGLGYAFIINYWRPNMVNYREIIGTQFNSLLQPGQKYYFSFFVSKSDTAFTSCSSNNIGFKLSSILYNSSNSISIDNNSFFHDQQIIANKEIWTVIKGSFISDSTYNYLYIGNFFDDSNTDTIGCSTFQAVSGYYIDQICFSLDSTFCDLYTGTNHVSDYFIITNPIVNNELNIEMNGNKHIQSKYEIFNIEGKRILNGIINTSKISIPFDQFRSGAYILKLYNESYCDSFKIIKL